MIRVPSKRKACEGSQRHNRAMPLFSEMPNDSAQHVAIAGGGIAGMAAGLALARAGWQPTVFEQASAFAEVGAGVQLGPNVTRILREWRLLDALLPSAYQPRYLNARRATTGEVLARMDLHALAQRYGAPYVSVHRADLHRVLMDAALAQGVRVEAGATVLAMTDGGEPDQGAHASPNVNVVWTEALSTPAPQTAHASWGIVADGVWSRLRQTLLSDAPPTWTGHIAYRALMPMSSLPTALRQAVRTDEVSVWMGPDMHVVCYPVSGGERLNVVCLVEAGLPEGVTNAQDWSLQKTQTQTRNDLNQALRGSGSVLRSLVDACEGWRLWPLYGRAPMQGAHQHAQGRMALVGDAAHPMLPYLAQGAGMAIEDAQALAQYVPASAHAEVPSRLQAFAQERWIRNARVQSRAMRNGEVFHARGLQRVGRDLGLKVLGERLMDMPWLYEKLIEK